jgi:cell pole-organizing protein PopZ
MPTPPVAAPVTGNRPAGNITDQNAAVKQAADASAHAAAMTQATQAAQSSSGGSPTVKNPPATPRDTTSPAPTPQETAQIFGPPAKTREELESQLRALKGQLDPQKLADWANNPKNPERIRQLQEGNDFRYTAVGGGIMIEGESREGRVLREIEEANAAASLRGEGPH